MTKTNDLCSYMINTVEKKMTRCKNNDGLSHQNGIKIPQFYLKQMSRFIFRHLILKKRLKTFITQYTVIS